MLIHGHDVWNNGSYIVREGTWLSLAIGVSAAIALVGVFPRMNVLERVGAYSFAIYLFHPFFVAGSRTALEADRAQRNGAGFRRLSHARRDRAGDSGAPDRQPAAGRSAAVRRHP